ncbi:MAG: DUF59 domain-containing protein [Candidatus Omnitrophica bacterium]|nr:DUF59 domain-containing protein [Candidatus Omnitrophota bacterium]
MPTKEQVIEVAKKCFDPEIPVNIWELGLIYDIQAEPAKVQVQMTLTSQGCPSAKQIPDELRARIINELGVKEVKVNVVFDPPWTPERISVEGKKKLGIEVED